MLIFYIHDFINEGILVSFEVATFTIMKTFIHLSFY